MIVHHSFDHMLSHPEFAVPFLTDMAEWLLGPQQTRGYKLADTGRFMVIQSVAELVKANPGAEHYFGRINLVYLSDGTPQNHSYAPPFKVCNEIKILNTAPNSVSRHDIPPDSPLLDAIPLVGQTNEVDQELLRAMLPDKLVRMGKSIIDVMQLIWHGKDLENIWQKLRYQIAHCMARSKQSTVLCGV